MNPAPIGLFVTGTDTEIGKTHVSCALLAAARARGRRVGAMKPVSAGAEMTPLGLRNEDAADLARTATVRRPSRTRARGSATRLWNQAEWCA